MSGTDTETKTQQEKEIGTQNIHTEGGTHTKYGQPNFRVFNHFGKHITRNPGICITILVTLEASYSEGDFWDNPIIHGHQHSTNSM